MEEIYFTEEELKALLNTEIVIKLDKEEKVETDEAT